MFDYIDGGSYEERTAARNESDLQALELRQRVLRDVSDLNLACMLFGQRLSLPVVLAPVGLAGMFAPRAEVLAARAAEAQGVAFTESTVSIASIEEVTAATSTPPWFQLYVMKDRSYAEGLLQRAADAGCRTLLLTVDLAVVGERYRDVRNGLVGDLSPLGTLRRGVDIASHPRWVKEVAIGGKPLVFGNLTDAVPGARSPQEFKAWVDAQFDASVTWDDLSWLRSNWSGEVVLKGVMDPDDARRAVDHGADGIVVSNHGGRQLDGTPSTVTALERIRPAVDPSFPILVDGGVRSGLDVLRMLAKGADACLIGRAWAWAVAAAGQAGVEHVIDTMRHELEIAMALTATTDVADVDSDVAF